MSGNRQKVSFDVKPQGFPGSTATTLVTTLKTHPAQLSLSSISLEPFSVYIGKISK
jgi:hypothetical protein